MVLVTALRRLWSFRLVVALGLVLALSAGNLTLFRVSAGIPPGFESRQYSVGLASASTLVDSPESQVIDLGRGKTNADIGSLSSRARLLANLMATSPLKDRIAVRARVAPSALLAFPPSDVADAAASPLDAGASAGPDDPEARILTLQVNEALPIITANAQAPTGPEAATLASAAVAELQAYLQQAAMSRRVPYARQLILEPLGPARSVEVARGSSLRLAALVVVAVLALWCLGILAVSGAALGWSRATEEEDRPPSPDRRGAGAPLVVAPLRPPDPERPSARDPGDVAATA